MKRTLIIFYCCFLFIKLCCLSDSGESAVRADPPPGQGPEVPREADPSHMVQADQLTSYTQVQKQTLPPGHLDELITFTQVHKLALHTAKSRPAPHLKQGKEADPSRLVKRNQLPSYTRVQKLTFTPGTMIPTPQLHQGTEADLPTWYNDTNSSVTPRYRS